MTCQQIADAITADQNAEVLLKAAVDIKTLAYIAAQNDLIAAQQAYQANLNDQLRLHGLANSMNCNLGH
jgi:hypothetical protein